MDCRKGAKRGEGHPDPRINAERTPPSRRPGERGRTLALGSKPALGMAPAPNRALSPASKPGPAPARRPMAARLGLEMESAAGQEEEPPAPARAPAPAHPRLSPADGKATARRNDAWDGRWSHLPPYSGVNVAIGLGRTRSAPAAGRRPPAGAAAPAASTAPAGAAAPPARRRRQRPISPPQPTESEPSPHPSNPQRPKSSPPSSSGNHGAAQTSRERGRGVARRCLLGSAERPWAPKAHQIAPPKAVPGVREGTPGPLSQGRGHPAPLYATASRSSAMSASCSSTQSPGFRE